MPDFDRRRELVKPLPSLERRESAELPPRRGPEEAPTECWSCGIPRTPPLVAVEEVAIEDPAVTMVARSTRGSASSLLKGLPWPRNLASSRNPTPSSRSRIARGAHATRPSPPERPGSSWPGCSLVRRGSTQLSSSRKYPALVVFYVFLSSHFHLYLIVESAEQLADFTEYLDSNLARELGRLYDWRGKFWARPYSVIPVSDEPEAQIERLKYLIGNSVKDQLVEEVTHWPGLHAAQEILEDRPLVGTWVNRTFLYRQRGRKIDPDKARETETLELDKLPCWAELSDDEYRARRPGRDGSPHRARGHRQESPRAQGRVEKASSLHAGTRETIADPTFSRCQQGGAETVPRGLPNLPRRLPHRLGEAPRWSPRCPVPRGLVPAMPALRAGRPRRAAGSVGLLDPQEDPWSGELLGSPG